MPCIKQLETFFIENTSFLEHYILDDDIRGSCPTVVQLNLDVLGSISNDVLYNSSSSSNRDISTK